MSAPSTDHFPTGFRHLTVFELDANGFPAATDATPYEGYHAKAAKALSISNVEPRRISHTGDDTLLQVVTLPPLESATVDLRLGMLSEALEEILTGKKSFSVGEAKYMWSGSTSQDGYEPSVGMLAYTDDRDSDGHQVWAHIIMPSATVFPKDTGLDAVPYDKAYAVTPALCTKHLWGASIVSATEGVTRGQWLRGVTQYIPKIVAWKGDGIEDTFLFPADAQAVSTAKIDVWVNGVLKTTSITKATTGLTFTASYEPADEAIIVCKYEIAKDLS